MNININKIKKLYRNYVTSGMSYSELDSKKLRQTRLINLIVFWLTITSIIFSLLSFHMKLVFIPLLLILSTTISICVVFYLRKTHNIYLSSHLFALNLCATVFIGNLFIGSPYSPAMLWVLSIPIVAAIIVDKAIYVYLLITIIMSSIIYGLYISNIIPFTPIPQDDLLFLHFISLITEIIVITFCLLNLIYEKDNYEDFLENANLKLSQKKDRYHFLAHHDELTNLANRASFNKQINRLKTSQLKDKHQIAFFYIDIDQMKIINDNYGHDIGDMVLLYMSKRIEGCFRANDILARIGGDEFAAVIIEKKGTNIAERIANRIIEQNKAPLKIKDHELNITLSIGIAYYPQDGETFEEVLNKADKALYQVKHNGKNDFAFYIGKSKEPADN